MVLTLARSRALLLPRRQNVRRLSTVAAHVTLCRGCKAEPGPQPLLLRESLEDGRATHLVLNSPKNRNALSQPMLETLKQELQQVHKDERVKVVVISARGPAFCAGHDLKELRTAFDREDSLGMGMGSGAQKQQYYQELFELCSEAMLLISTCPVPVVAQTHGVATAAGCQLAASCDVVYSSSTCKFATPGVSIGLFCSTPAVPILRSMGGALGGPGGGSKLLSHMLYTGEMISAEQAERGGLVAKVLADALADGAEAEPFDYSSGALHPEVARIVSSIAGRSRASLRIGKEALREQAACGADLAAAYERASRAMVENMLEGDAEEGIRSFLEKRRPRWE